MGIKTFDSSDLSNFYLYVFLIFKNGDIVAIKKLLDMKGHNSYCPCQSCKIKGVRNITTEGKIYYSPLMTPQCEHHTCPSVDPCQLQMCTHGHFISVIKKINSAIPKKEQDTNMKQYGIWGSPALHRVGSLNFTICAPLEWMHLLLKNVIPGLMNLWTGRFKDLDEGTDNYKLVPHIWEEFGQETVNAVKTIPSSFVCVLGNIAENRSSFTAESWGFWFIYLALILLKNHFLDNKYYVHMCKLVRLMKTSIKLELTTSEVDELKEGFVQWVKEYEECVPYGPSQLKFAITDMYFDV